MSQVMGRTERTVWVVSELYYPEETSTGYFLSRIADGIARRYRVRALCGQPSYAARGIRAPRREIQNGVLIYRCWATTLPKDIPSFRVINWITITTSLFLHAVLLFRTNDYVLVVTNPPPLPFLIFLACRLRGSQCLLLVHDVYPDVLVAIGVMPSNAFQTRIFARAVHWLYSAVDRIIVLGRDMYTLVCRRLEGDDSKVVIIPQWADSQDIVPSRRKDNALLQSLGLDGKFVVQYSGNMGRTHDLETIVEAARRLQDRDDIHFLFIGWGGKKRWLEQVVTSEGLKNVTVLEYLPRDKLSVSLNACDIATIAFIPGMAGVSVPSRMYNILAAGKPIIALADEGSELACLVKEEKVGWIVATDEAERFTEIILLAEERKSSLAEMGLRGRQVAEKKYNFESVISKYYALIEGLNLETRG